MIKTVEEIDILLKNLFPINRSILGEGNRRSLQLLQEIIPLNILEYKSQTKVYDWTIPKEWNVNEAWIKNSKGEKIINFDKLNLHLLGYSKSINEKLSFNELKNNLYYIKDLPTAVPYRTSYYNEDWGFCISYNQFLELFQENETYEVFIDTNFKQGSLSIGELLIEGKSKKEYLISSYICHPSMANDSLSGVIIATFIAKKLLEIKDSLEFSYRFVFLPETIGAITYLSHNENIMKNINNALVMTTCGGPGEFGYKQSFDENNFINQMMEDTFEENSINYITYPFDIRGSDERQYSSQTFRINCLTLTKDKYYEYPYYHTSLDNLDFVKAINLEKTLSLYLKLIDKMDKNILYKNMNPSSEVMLSKHNLYPKVGGSFLPNASLSYTDLILWSLFYLDGTMDLYSLSKKINIEITILYQELEKLEEKQILKRVQ